MTDTPHFADEAQVEMLREAGRLLFLRGQVVQGETEAKIAAFWGGDPQSVADLTFCHPGGGRGPVGKRSLVRAALRHHDRSNWAPAFAGVV